ncbi:hypothetical protein PPERSA_03818 [Pseudocohnilembus persalinus]|uniref:Uncharacterized protein n=1 Tax=Pseudocohnilembus persalinus TaxID=266149 RepID=A0A0V0QU06_PSEPJ|nr:hypothetical protein PPERSA_03818 [Pseudocohnilembus persalinus]|eukprot:KRX05881.1 hypothetical protein PPERSA_03818 [Pseudocohnilembus persalinus]
MEQQFGIIYHNIRGIQQELRDCQKNIGSIQNDFKIPTSSPKKFQKKKSSSQLNQNNIFNSNRNLCNIFYQYDDELDSQSIQFQIASYSQESPRRPLKQFQSKIQLNQELNDSRLSSSLYRQDSKQKLKQFSRSPQRLRASSKNKFNQNDYFNQEINQSYNFSKFGRFVSQNSPNKRFKTFKSFKREIRSNTSSGANSPLGKYDTQEKKQAFNVQPQLYHIKQARNKINQIRGSASKSPSNRSPLKSKLALEKIRLSKNINYQLVIFIQFFYQYQVKIQETLE